MNEVSTNLPMAVQNQTENFNEKTEPSTIKYVEEIPEYNNLERIPEADYVEINPENINEFADQRMLMASMPNPEQVIKGVGLATTLLIGLKSFIEAAGDLWKTVKDNFKFHKQEEIYKQAHKEMMKQQQKEYKAAA